MKARGAATVIACGLLAACAGQPQHQATRTTPPKPPTEVAPPPWGPPPVTKNRGGVYKVGNPYTINGVLYVPREDPNYVETGIASWYGDQFNGERTANGEYFDMNRVSAAHRTLPMPCMVRVTNLDNGKTILVRVNDRGPFARGRIIDLSAKAAELLGFHDAGTARVRVAYAGPASLDEGAPPVAQVAQEPRRQVKEEPKGIYVQAGAFANPDNAQRLKDRLAPVGHAFIHSAMVNGTNFYRVRIGPLPSVEDADLTLAQVMGLGEANALIVVDK